MVQPLSIYMERVTTVRIYSKNGGASVWFKAVFQPVVLGTCRNYWNYKDSKVPSDPKHNVVKVYLDRKTPSRLPTLNLGHSLEALKLHSSHFVVCVVIAGKNRGLHICNNKHLSKWHTTLYKSWRTVFINLAQARHYCQSYLQAGELRDCMTACALIM